MRFRDLTYFSILKELLLNCALIISILCHWEWPCPSLMPSPQIMQKRAYYQCSSQRHCIVPPPHLAIGASMSYLWDSSWLFKDKGPLMVFTWEQVSKCQFQQFIFHVRIEMSHPSIMSTQSFQNRMYFSPCENVCTSHVFILVCVNERSAFGQCQQ